MWINISKFIYTHTHNTLGKPNCSQYLTTVFWYIAYWRLQCRLSFLISNSILSFGKSKARNKENKNPIDLKWIERMFRKNQKHTPQKAGTVLLSPRRITLGQKKKLSLENTNRQKKIIKWNGKICGILFVCAFSHWKLR